MATAVFAKTPDNFQHSSSIAGMYIKFFPAECNGFFPLAVVIFTQ
jgi:hypothetical protein